MPAMSSRHRYEAHPVTSPPVISNSFALVPLYGRPPANAIAHGSLSSVIGHLVDNRTMVDDRLQVMELRADAAVLMDK